MSSRLFIPYSALNPPETKELIINQPARCSHCNSEPADFFETHPVTLKAKRIPHRQIGRRYRTEKRLLVRLPLCEACYLNDYLLTPDSYSHDNTPLGMQRPAEWKVGRCGGSPGCAQHHPDHPLRPRCWVFEHHQNLLVSPADPGARHARDHLGHAKNVAEAGA